MALTTPHIADGSGVRAMMLDEIRRDLKSSDLYVGAFLNDVGRQAWPMLLEEAMTTYDSGWLAHQLRRPDYWLSHYWRKGKNGPVSARVPSNAADMLADGEFGRFYIRGVSRVSLATGRPSVVVVRLRQSSRPRPESDALLGEYIDANNLLEDLRGNKGTDTYSGVPGGPNSGLGVALV